MAATAGLAVALLAFAASAQDAPQGNAATAAPKPDSVRSSPLPAPVGHRQPRASDIPQAPPRDDVSAAIGPRDDINDRLRICRGC